MDEMMPAVMFLSISSVILIPLGLYILAIYLLETISLYKIGKKLGYDKSFLPWLGEVFSAYALSDMTEIKDFSVTPKLDRLLKIRTKKEAFIIYLVLIIILPLLPFAFILGCMVFFVAASFVHEAVLTVFPGIMLLLYLLFIAAYIVLSYAVAAYTAVMYYVYLRDLSCIFIADKEFCKTVSALASVLNLFFYGLTIPVYLCYLSRKKPLQNEPQRLPSENMTSDIPE